MKTAVECDDGRRRTKGHFLRVNGHSTIDAERDESSRDSLLLNRKASGSSSSDPGKPSVKKQAYRLCRVL